MKYTSTSFLTFIAICCFTLVQAQTSTLVSVGTGGKLVYKADSKGNTVPDFSGVGYQNSEVPIPTIAVVKTVYPIAGDNLANIQSAIDQVATMPLDNYGFRGAILFKKGVYNISDTIKITASGIVLRGEGTDTANGTWFVANTPTQYNLISFVGSGGTAVSNSSKKPITDVYVPIGAKQLNVSSASGFKAGNTVFVHRIPNQKWIDTLKMAQWGWTASSYDIYYERKVTAVTGNTITLDAPMVDVIDTNFSTGEVMKYSSTRIQNCGIENMRMVSYFASDSDENHGWEAITFENITNSWARNIDVYYFGYSAAHIYNSCAWITVQNCKMLDGKSVITGERRYSFEIDGQRCLVQNCTTRRGRHDYVTSSRTAGPNVFYNSSATIQNNDIGPHHRWATGILFDNITSNASQDVQNRASFGTGQGWAGGQIMFWNCKAGKMIVQDPATEETNWAIGCTSPTITNVGDLVTEPLGFVESKNKAIVATPSLYLAQLADRFPNAKKQTQTIVFDTLPYKQVGDTDFTPKASATSALKVTFTSSNTAVATIVSNKIHIIAAGTAIITALQAGDTTFQAAPNFGQLLTVKATPLPIGITKLSASVQPAAKGIILSWQRVNNDANTTFQIEKSTNGIAFSKIGALTSSAAMQYQFTDKSPTDINYYRIKLQSSTHNDIYSNTLVVKNKYENAISVYPNPVKNYIVVAGLSGTSTIRISNEQGKILQEQTTQANSTSINLVSHIAGHYTVEVIRQGEVVAVKQVIIE